MMGNSGEQLLKIGDVVEGRYRVIKVLGEGGMGTVFLAEHTLIKRRVAIKVLHAELATDAHVVERFMNEARAAGTLGHPNIVESTDMGFTHGHIPYIVFEYLEGALLTDEVYRVGGLPVRRAVWIAQQIASALRAAHNAEIVHRDLKTDNIFLTDKDESVDHVKVLDFGISRFLDVDDEQTRRGMVMGTPEFMSPEQITAPASVDRRTDIYALGVILYEMIEARRPFVADEDPQELLERIVRDDPPPFTRPGIPIKLAEMVIHKLLAKDREDRFQSMADVEAALESFITQDNMRRRRTPLSMPIASPEDIARYSDLIPRPVASRDTPVPGRADSTLQPITLPAPPAQKRHTFAYGVAAVGLIIGGLGISLAYSMFQKDTVATNETVAPAPAALPAPAPPPSPAPAAAVPATPSKIAVQFDSNVPDAHVTFRRRLSKAPSSFEVSSNNVVELVEVSAPGYKTTRYWLTFDRPTHLTAKLARGNGMVEATEEQTLIALGEVAAPEPAKPAVATTVTKAAVATKPAVAAVKTPVTTAPKAPKVVATAEPVARTVKPAAPAVETPAPRKIGKSAAAETETEVASVDDNTVLGPTRAPASVTKTATDESLIERPALPSIPKLPPKPTISRSTLAAVVGRNRPAIIKCIVDGKKANPKLKGTLTLHAQVDAMGSVKHPQIESSVSGATLVAACVVKATRSWKFPARSGEGMADVAYPFVIN